MVIIAETSSDADFSYLVDTVAGLRARHKYLIVTTKNENLSFPQNRTLDFSVIMKQNSTGIFKAYYRVTKVVRDTDYVDITT